jgi:TBC1 domain family member 15
LWLRLTTLSSWVLIAFKREFPFHDVLRLWEVLWTNYYSNEFILFVALAILESHRDVILRYLVEVRSSCPLPQSSICFSRSLQFDEILKYCNDLSMTIELDTTLAQAEVLFLSFAQLAADIDRREAEARSQSGLRQRKGTSGPPGEDQGQSTAVTTPKPPQLSEDLRHLLKAS